MASTVNGHQVIDSTRTIGPHPRLRKWIIPGTNRHFTLRDGSMGFILAHVALWFHEKVARLDAPGSVWDEWGWAVRPVRGSSSGFSNHAGGVAIDVNATQHPIGVHIGRNFNSQQIVNIRMRLRWALYRGVIRWGGDWSRPDGMHFEIAPVSLSTCEKVAVRLMRTSRGKRILAVNPGAAAVILEDNPHTPTTTIRRKQR